MNKEKTETFRSTEELSAEIKKAAKKGGFKTKSEWIRQTLKEKLNKS